MVEKDIFMTVKVDFYGQKKEIDQNQTNSTIEKCKRNHLASQEDTQ